MDQVNQENKEGFDPKKEGILQSVRNGAAFCKAVEEAGVGLSTAYAWTHQDPKFGEAVNAARDARVGVVEDSLLKHAEKGNATLLIFWLCNRAPHRWQSLTKTENFHKHEGSLEANIKSREDFATLLNAKGKDGRPVLETIRRAFRDSGLAFPEQDPQIAASNGGGK